MCVIIAKCITYYIDGNTTIIAKHGLWLWSYRKQTTSLLSDQWLLPGCSPRRASSDLLTQLFESDVALFFRRSKLENVCLAGDYIPAVALQEVISYTTSFQIPDSSIVDIIKVFGDFYCFSTKSEPNLRGFVKGCHCSMFINGRSMWLFLRSLLRSFNRVL